MNSESYEAIVVGGGTAGVVCAASLAIRGVPVLLVVETAEVGRATRNVELDGHIGYVQQPAWHFGWGGGHWARVVREQNLKTPVHFSPPVHAKVRGMGPRTQMPITLSASSICDLLFRMLPIPIDESGRADVERVIHAGLMIPYEDLCQLHDTPIGQWLDQLQAGDFARLVVELLAAAVAGLPQECVGPTFSVFGVFSHIRTYFGGDGYFTVIEPDIRRGLLEPLADRVEQLGGTVWRGTRIDRVIVEDGAARGIRTADGRIAEAAHIALGVGNPRMARFFDDLPKELVAPLAKEAEFLHEQIMIATLLTEPVVDFKDLLFIFDPSTGSNLWFIPLDELAPWNRGNDGRQFCMQWWAGARDGTMDPGQVEKYLDEVCEEEFPGWQRAIGPRVHVKRPYHWLNPCYTGPKVPRRSPTVSGLWYVGESTEPVGGIATEQATYAGYTGALAIADELGHGKLNDPPFG